MEVGVEKVISVVMLVVLVKTKRGEGGHVKMLFVVTDAFCFGWGWGWGVTTIVNVTLMLLLALIEDGQR